VTVGSISHASRVRPLRAPRGRAAARHNRPHGIRFPPAGWRRTPSPAALLGGLCQLGGRQSRAPVCNSCEREFLCVYGAISPPQGRLGWMIAPQMNTDFMSKLLAQVSAEHRRDFIVTVGVR